MNQFNCLSWASTARRVRRGGAAARGGRGLRAPGRWAGSVLLAGAAAAAPGTSAPGTSAPGRASSGAEGLGGVVLDAGQPPGLDLPVEGRPVASARYQDRTGAHLVVVTETAVRASPSPDGETRQSKRLYGYHFVLSGKPAKRLWRTQDFVTDCPSDLTLRYQAGSLTVTDLDHDGQAETAFAYRLACRSDVSPEGLKLLMHEGAQKYAVRGTTLLPDMDPAYAGGELRLDPAFDRAPPGFASFARAQFQRYQRLPDADTETEQASPDAPRALPAASATP